MEDWLHDPLWKVSRGSEVHRFSSLDGVAQRNWEAQHGSTRLKLDGAAYHYRMAQGSSSLVPPYDRMGMYARLKRWHLDSFFFELMSSFDSMLQEVNLRYQVGIPIDDVWWSDHKKTKDKFRNKIPAELFELIDKEWKADWFVRVCEYRNMVTHRFLLPTSEFWGESGPAPDLPRDKADSHEVNMLLKDRQGKFIEEPIEKCEEYLSLMAQLIAKAWGSFKLEPTGEGNKTDANSKAN